MLLVSREPWAFECLWTLGRANGWQLESSGFGIHALERMRSRVVPHVVLLDLGQEDAEGLDTLRWLSRVRPEVPVILLSSPDNNEQMAEAVRLGAHDYVPKPCQAKQLERVLGRHLNHCNGNNSDGESQEIEPMGEELFFISGSPVMRKLRARVELLAQVNVPVLIIGEGGSGKEATARLIHKLSVRSGFRFLKANCAALPEELLDSELFSSDRSAFTGSGLRKQAKSELCHGGSILLDKVEQMPAPLQLKLLQVLHRKRPLQPGKEVARNVDIRILAATDMDIKQAIAENKLREDLYYRLSAFTIRIPPLRHRKEEIPILLSHFMNRIAKQCGLPPRNLSPDLLEACQQYSWPGNLRELENFVKCYLVMGEESLTVSELMPTTNSSDQIMPTHADDSVEALPRSLKSLVRRLKNETEKNAIAGALEETHWNRKTAARLLRISYRALLYKIQQYHMTPPDLSPHGKLGRKNESELGSPHLRPSVGPEESETWRKPSFVRGEP
jgi:two-component system response regulator AtoC